MVRPRKFTDQDILHAARAVFLEHGPAASTTLIADAVGMSQAALFKRFGTKDRLLLLSLVPSGSIAFIERLQAGPDDRPIPDQLVAVALEASRFFDTMMPCLMTLRAAGLNPGILSPPRCGPVAPRLAGCKGRWTPAGCARSWWTPSR
ncbi:MAG: helix-turn-helix transcriptional regulator [Oligoflexia bacterium]|nr:helix-turn-helix transcriptional regulator [Oligoflexia bacterium]